MYLLSVHVYGGYSEFIAVKSHTAAPLIHATLVRPSTTALTSRQIDRDIDLVKHVNSSRDTLQHEMWQSCMDSQGHLGLLLHSPWDGMYFASFRRRSFHVIEDR